MGVANLGNADNLTGHHFAQANLFAFGPAGVGLDARLGGHRDRLDADDLEQRPARRRHHPKMMMGSWESLVSYQTPLGIGHQFAEGAHYRPDPADWAGRDDWSPIYYNKADSVGLGFDRSPTGSNLAAQYFPRLQQRYGEHRLRPGEPADVVPPRAVGPSDGQRADVLGRTGLPLPDGRAVRDLDAGDLGRAPAAHRRAPVRRGPRQAGGPRGGRRRLAGHLGELLEGVQRAGHPGRRRAAVGHDRREREDARRLQPVGHLVHHPGAGRGVADDHQGADDRPEGPLRDHLPGGRRARSGGRQGHHGELLRPPGEELRLQPGARHDADDPARRRRAPGVLRTDGAALQRPRPGRHHDRPDGHRQRRRPGRLGRGRAGDQPHRAGSGHRHERRSVVGLHRGPEHDHHRQRRVRVVPARPAVAVGPAGREPAASGRRVPGHHRAAGRPAGQRQHRPEPGPPGRRRRLDGRVQGGLLPRHSPPTTSRAVFSGTRTTTTT